MFTVGSIECLRYSSIKFSVFDFEVTTVAFAYFTVLDIYMLI